jgi:predicted RecA/RadA family phage recombinase
MKNFVQDGKEVNYTVTGDDVKSGDVVVIGKMVGVAVTDGKVGETIAVSIDGVYRLPKVNGALTQGAAVYAAAANNAITSAATSNTFAGYVWKAAAAGDATVDVKLSF